MKVIYALEKVPHSIFLIGPTPRSKEVDSWRPEALSILTELNYSGTVYVPEPKDKKWEANYVDQIEWENTALQSSTCIACWLPRDLDDMPAYTTNVEFGIYLRSGKMLYGRPDAAPKTAYLDHMYRKETNRTPHNDLERLLVAAVDFL